MPDDPNLIVEIAFSAALTGTALHLSDVARGILDAATLAPDSLWVDVTDWVTACDTFRGARRADGPVVQYEQGTATITFRNDDRRFDPTNLAGPYVAAGVTQVEPMRAVRVRGVRDGVTYPIWRGFTNEWTIGYDGPNSSWATVTCFDAFGVLAANIRGAVSAVGAGETTSARVARVLNGISWPTSDRIMATGAETVSSTTLEGSVLSELQLVTDTELGELWMDAQGRLTFRNRNAHLFARSKAPQVKFGDDVSLAVTTINHATNPSVETGVSGGWAAIGGTPPTLSRSSTRARFGTWSLLATWGTGGFLPGVAYDITGLIAGKTYTISVYVWVPTGSPPIDTIVGGATFGSSSTTVDQWERLVWTGTATATTMGFGLWPQGSPTSGQQVWIDGLLVEESEVANAYVDGDQVGCEWDGPPHASTSRRLPELPATAIELGYDATSITNQVTAACVGGSTQVAVDAVSVSAYLTRSYPRTDLLLQTDAETLMWAEQVLARRSMPEQRIKMVRLKPSRDDRVAAHALGREIGDRVRAVKRPPGGGAPIVRDGWIRGIEHRVVVDRLWETDFVLEDAPYVETIIDTFSRTEVNGWGITDSLKTWAVSGGTLADHSVTAGKGRQANPVTNSLHSGLVILDGPNQSISADVTIPVVPTGAGITLWVAGRAASISTYYTVQLGIAVTTGAAALTLYRRVGGTLSSSLASTPAGTHSAGNTWRIQLETLGSVIRAKAWRPGIDVEPGWQATATDTTITTGNQCGVLSRRETGNTNGTVNIDWDSFTATDMYAWT